MKIQPFPSHIFSPEHPTNFFLGKPPVITYALQCSTKLKTIPMFLRRSIKFDFFILSIVLTVRLLTSFSTSYLT